MTENEAHTRTAAAMDRLGKANPIAALVSWSMLFLGALMRGAVYLCIGFGSASLAGISAWWGLPIAIVAAQTLGRGWRWMRRDARVRAIEDVAERAVAAKEAST